MATTARQPKPPRKGMPEPAARRPSAWTAGARASPTFSPGMPNARLPTGPQTPNSGGFPPLGQPNGAPRNNASQDRVLQQLSGLTGTTVTLSTKTGIRYEGVIGSTNGEGDTTGVTLKDAKEISNPGAPLRDTVFIASTNIDTWASGPADAKAPNGDSFKTDVDISKKIGQSRERELQAWSDDIPAAVENAASGASGRFGNGDDLTFGPGAAHGGHSWDQFAANEKLFGVKAGFDEEAYTTKIDRSAPNFKEKEKKAAAIANEIMAAATSNTHVAEERVMNFTGGEGTNEEDKFSAVVRSAGAYVPPGARRPQQSQQNVPVPNGVTPPSKLDLPKVSVNAPDGSTASPAKPDLPVPKVASPAPAGAGSNTPTTADAVPAFRNFVSTERDRLMKKKQALMKNEIDKRVAELVKFSQTFKLNKPIPDDLVSILAKDEDKQRQIKEKSTKDAQTSGARTIGSTSTVSALALPPALRLPTNPGSSKPTVSSQGAAKSPILSKAVSNAGVPTGTAAKENASGKRITMVIQAIPPFKGKRASTSGQSGAPTTTNAPVPPSMTVNTNGSGASANASRTNSTSGNPPSTPLSPTASNRLNANASLFRPIKGSQLNGSGSGSASASPKPRPAEASPPSQAAPNPFFGHRVIKKAPPVHIKEDFNPFKYHKVVDAAQVSATWPYNGKRYAQTFPPLPQQAPPQPQHMGPPAPPPPMPPQQYEESSDPAAQQAAAAARGFVYAYPYPYPGQPMMPGMPPPPPPGAYMPGPYMQPIPYPHMPPPNAMYPGTPMGQMPPPGAYMAPPGAYPPPPNGNGPRPSMPPTPIPQHAHPYYQQSPQLGHAIPYQMMMPPPGAPGGGPHPYEGAPAPPVAMGGVGHA